jgi:putative Mn2+ efflux pump MntP
VGLVVVPGRDRTVRFLAALLGSAGGGLLAFAVGAARGLHVHAPGAALLWPLIVAVLTTLRLLAGLVSSPDGDAGLRGRGA